MPKIQEYSRQVATPGPSGRQIQADTRVGDAMQSLGRTVGDFGQSVANWHNERDTFEAQKQALKLRDQLDQEMNEAKMKAPPGARNFSENVKSHLETRRSQALDSAADLTPSAQRVFERSLLEIDSKFQSEARAFEAEALAKETVSFIKESEENSRNSVRANPFKLDEYLVEQQKLNSSAPGVSEQWKADRNQEVSRALHDAALDGIVTNAETNPRTTVANVDALIADMKNEKSRWIKGTTNPEYDRDISRLQRLRENLLEKRKQFIATDFKERMDQIQATGVDHGLYTSGWIKANISDPELQKRMLYQESTSREVGKVVASTGAMPFGELVSKVRAANDKQSLGATDTYYKDAAVASSYQTALEQRTKAWNADPAGYTMSVSIATKSTYDQFLKNPSLETAQAYAETTIAEQARMYPGEMPSVVPKERAAQIQAVLAKIPQTGNGAEEAVATLQAEHNLWGKNWPIAVKDLRREKAINETQYVASTMFGDPAKKWFAEDLVRASVSRREELTKQIPVEGAVKNAQQAAVEALRPFTDTLNGLADGPKIKADFITALTQYQLYKGAQAGDDLSGKAEEYANKMINESYNFVGGYRVPVNENSGSIERATRALTESGPKAPGNLVTPIFYQDLVIPQSLFGIRESDAKARYTQRLKDHGRFVTDNDQGLRYVDEYENPVYVKKDGKAVPLKWTWDELKALDKQVKSPRMLAPMYGGDEK